MKTGWYSTDEFFVVKPLKNGCRQSLIMGANRYYTNHWNISMGIFSSNIVAAFEKEALAATLS